MASSLICATKKLSTMLYKELTSIEITIGSAIETSSGNTGFSFIKFSFIITSICDLFCWWAYVQARTLLHCPQKKPRNYLLSIIAWRKELYYKLKNPHQV